MAKTPFNPDTFFKQACYFEASLILVAVFLGWIAGINPFEHLSFSESAIAYGVLGTAPLFVALLALEQMQIDSLAQIRRLLVETLGPGLQRYHWVDVFMLAAIAGVSEEILFRGVIQPWMESLWGMTVGLIGSNILFGLAHAVTPLYALLAASVGLYLGWSLDYGGDRNLWTPIIIHGLYDFLAFMALIRAYRARQ